MGQFHIRTLLWLTACAAIGAWLLTLPPSTYGCPFPDGYQIEWLWEIDYFQRITLAIAIFSTPYVVAWIERIRNAHRERFQDSVSLLLCGTIVFAVLCLLISEL